LRGGRYFGRPFHRAPVVVHRPVVRLPHARPVPRPGVRR
jgi:hypothetical protein